ncbi:Uncharacterised protein [Chlamydia trachomatis]|nr:Uncharacterised protein [Chlamydia trachomatis]
MTRKFTKNRSKHTVRATGMLPREKKFPNAKIKGEAHPEDKIHRVEAKFRPSRNRQRYKRSEGKIRAEAEERKENTQKMIDKEHAKFVHTPKSISHLGKWNIKVNSIQLGIATIFHELPLKLFTTATRFHTERIPSKNIYLQEEVRRIFCIYSIFPLSSI